MREINRYQERPYHFAISAAHVAVCNIHRKPIIETTYITPRMNSKKRGVSTLTEARTAKGTWRLQRGGWEMEQPIEHITEVKH